MAADSCRTATLTLSLTVDDPADAADFYCRAFGAQRLCQANGGDGRVAWSELRIGDSTLMLSDEGAREARSPLSLRGTTACVRLRVPDAPRLAQQALEAGARLQGSERNGCCRLTDPFGHHWVLETEGLRQPPTPNGS